MNMPDLLEEQIEKRVEEIKRDISGKKGEIALIARQILAKVAETHYQNDDRFFYLEAGVVSGDLAVKTHDSFLDKSIDVSLGILDSGTSNREYYFIPDLAIPVQRKFVSGDIFHFSFNLDVEDLEKAKQGELEFSKLELLGMRNIPGYQPTLPCLEKLEIIAGDEQVRRFAVENTESPEKINRFFKLLKNPEEVDKTLDEHYKEARETLAKRLVINVAGIVSLDKEIESIQDEVLRAHLLKDMEQGGSTLTYWSNEEAGKYWDLRENISRKLNQIESLLREADKSELIKHNRIDGRYIGFPAAISPEIYLKEVKEKIIPGIKSRISAINDYLRKQEEKTREK